MIASLQIVFRVLIALIAIFVLINLSPVSLAEWSGEDACPNIGPLPACYLVMLCYAMIGLAAAFNPRRLVWMFIIGWLPVFALALTGTTLEVLGHGTCPVSESGIPMCYISLALAVALVPMYALAGGFKKLAAKKDQLKEQA